MVKKGDHNKLLTSESEATGTPGLWLPEADNWELFCLLKLLLSVSEPAQQQLKSSLQHAV